MKIFALETDMAKIKQRIISPTEQELLTINFHPFLFWGKVLREIFWTLVLAAAVLGALFVGAPRLLLFAGAFLFWFFFIFLRVIVAYLDWKFDGIVVTTEKVVIIDQKSVVKQLMRQMNLENVASVHVETQWWNLFPFGKICFDLKEGTGVKDCFKYVPNADMVATKISDAVMSFHQRRTHMYMQRPTQGYGGGQHQSMGVPEL